MFPNFGIIASNQIACYRYTFDDGSVHQELVELDYNRLTEVTEMDRIMGLYMALEVADRPVDYEELVELAAPEDDGDLPEELFEAAFGIAAVLDTYTSNKHRTVVKYETVMVDHLGNELPLDIEYNIWQNKHLVVTSNAF